jgi:hypothetical protein
MEGKFYSEEEMKHLLDTMYAQTIKGFMEWVEKETIIINRDTKRTNIRLCYGLKPDPKKPSEYIFPKLKEHGITMNNKFEITDGI